MSEKRILEGGHRIGLRALLEARLRRQEKRALMREESTDLKEEAVSENSSTPESQIRVEDET